MLRLLGLFIVVPFIDLLILIKIGSGIGFWPTLGVVIVPGLLGAIMARSQGVAVLSEIKRDISLGRLPGDKLIDGIFILFGGLLLMTPGLITDLIGLSVLVPRVRKFYRNIIVYRLWSRIAASSLRLYIRK